MCRYCRCWRVVCLVEAGLFMIGSILVGRFVGVSGVFFFFSFP